MNVIETPPGMLKSLRRRASGSFQRTFATPLEHLPAFVGAVLGEETVRGSSAVIEAVVFEPEHLERLLEVHGLPARHGAPSTLVAEGPQESALLLEALLADWLDFYFLPEPKQLFIYADHDEFATLFASRKAPLSRAADRLKDVGVREIADYARTV